MSKNDTILRELLKETIGRMLTEKKEVLDEEKRVKQEEEEKVLFVKTQLAETLQRVDWDAMGMTEAKKILFDLEKLSSSLAKKL